MNENVLALRLRDFMESEEGWGREQGREVYRKLISYVEVNPGVLIFRVVMDGVNRVDISFASETIIELAKRFRGKKGFCFVDLRNKDMLENWEAAAERKEQPMVVWNEQQARIIGVQPSQGNLSALTFALGKPRVRAAELVSLMPGMTISNASMKFKQLWEQGFLLRREDIAQSGGVEYSYFCIR